MIMGAWGLGRRRGWTNPYITDGLVAMWDGEWNVGGGVHDGTASQWLDVVGSRTLLLNGSAAFGANYMETTDSASGAIGNFDLNAAYFEMVFYVDKTSDWYSIFDGLSGKWVWGDPVYSGASDGGINELYWQGWSIPNIQGVMQICMSFDGAVCTANGRSVSVDMAYGGDDAIGPFSIFGNVDNIGEERCCCGKCFSARFYGAIPNVSQRSLNLEIDRTRFSLP